METIDAHRFRIAGAKALAEGTESFDKVLPDLADTYTGANEQFRVDARILDGATFRIAGAKALAEGTESFDKVLPDLADRPDMFLDDELAEEIEKKALAKGDREKW